ncbi:terpene synthase [Marasmius fiardii PR-910]|nr:terpene synthase [Marasmius fiardii PR-910]
MYNRIDTPATCNQPFTDYSRWRLLVNEGGRHTWHYLKTEEECAEWPQTAVDKFWLGLPTGLPELPPAKNAQEAAENGWKFYKNLQAHDGHWPGEYGGPMFLIPGLVIGSYISGMSFKDEERREIIRYLMNRAHPEDGGWGIHVEGHSTVFGTALNYAALRLLGVSADHPTCTKARGTLHKLGGACGIPSWGKFWLSLLNVYDWEGNNPVPPELWLLPEWLPVHPHRWWIHTRNVYIPMSYLYGVRFKAPEDDLVLALREELYPQYYYTIDWPAQRNNVCPADLYMPHTTLFEVLEAVLGWYEMCALPPLRRAAIEKAYELVVMEDENTGYQTIGPVSKMFNLVARVHREGLESEAAKRHEDKRSDFMWMGAEGMMMTGTNGSQVWDTSFISQALVETGLGDVEENKKALVNALAWLEQAQMVENPRHYEVAYRHRTKGAWGFSTKEQGYTVTDCTGEALKSVLYIQGLGHTPKLVSEERMCWAVDTLLSLQNENGAYSDYEPVRAPHWIELINPAEVFGDIMTGYYYPECTTSVITCLAIFRKQVPHYRSNDVHRTINKAIGYLHLAQRPEGAWLGSWGICFTYATMFALESLSLVDETYENSSYAKKACDYLVSMQREDGGWGESYKACELAEWVEHENTQVVQTCWAGLALMYAQYPHPGPLEKAVKLVMDRQLPDGSWAQEAIEGVFNKNCAIAYPNFKFSFPIWMLGKAHSYLDRLKGKDKVNGHARANGKANGGLGNGQNGTV